jgi:tetratricopeptide (TPR) repeat protein
MEAKQAKANADAEQRLRVVETNTVGSFPADAAAAMNQGMLAGMRQEWLTAIQNFQEARKTAPNAPELFYNLGLAESHIAGRELRSICWLGAYLTANPSASNALAVKSQIDALDIKSHSNNADLIKSVQDAASRIPPPVRRSLSTRKGYEGLDSLDREAELAANKQPGENIKALVSVALLWARAGDFVTALKTASLIQEVTTSQVQAAIAEAQAKPGHPRSAFLAQDVTTASQVQAAIAEAQAKAGDFTNALSTADLVQEPTCKNQAHAAIAEVQAKGGDFPDALRTADLIQDARKKRNVQYDIAKAQLDVGDSAAAKVTFTSALKTADLQADQVNVSGASAALLADLRKAATQGALYDKSLILLSIADVQVKEGDMVTASRLLNICRFFYF